MTAIERYTLEQQLAAVTKERDEAWSAAHRILRTCPLCGFDGSAAETAHFPGNHECSYTKDLVDARKLAHAQILAFEDACERYRVQFNDVGEQLRLMSNAKIDAEKERDEWKARAERAESALAKCRAALSDVEWGASDFAGGGNACPSCRGDHPTHDATCALVDALAETEETK